MSEQRQMTVRLEPSRIHFRRTTPKLVHDVGEIVRVPTAEADVTATVFAHDAETAEPINAVVHVAGLVAPANQPFHHRFKSEFDEKSQSWTQEVVWVEAPGYDNVELDYKILVEPARP